MQVASWCSVAVIGLVACEADMPPPGRDWPTFGPTVLEVGELDRPQKSVFGKIEDVVALVDGDFVVLDGHAMSIRLFDSEGQFLSEAGRSGEGPGEFLSPVALALRDDSTLVVLDGAQRLVEFRVRDSELLHVRDSRIEVFGRDVCALSGRIFVQALHLGRGVQELDRDGRIARSFHPVPVDHGFDLGPTWMHDLDDEAVSGFMACLPEISLVVVVSQWLPTIYAYDPDGQLAWTADVPDYRIAEPVLTDLGGMRWDRGDGSDLIVALEVGPRGHLFVQAVRYAMGVRSTSVQPSTFVVDGSTGEIARLDAALPVLLDVSGSTAVGVVTEPYPRLQFFVVESEEAPTPVPGRR